MTIHTLKHAALTALAAALLAPAANAALSYSTDDLFLGFRQPANATTDYLINIGQASTFRDATSTLTLSLPGLAGDLTTAFGANWASTVTWGVVGTTQNTAAAAPDNLTRLLYSSEPVGTTPTASSSQSGPANSIISMKSYWQGLTASQGTVANSAFEDPNNAGSWTARVSTSFGSPGVLNTIESAVNSNLDLFRIPQTTSLQPVTNEGFFSLDTGAGTVSFNDSAVPEPSTLLFGCALVGALGLNRRRVASAA